MLKSLKRKKNKIKLFSNDENKKHMEERKIVVFDNAIRICV